MASRLMMLEVLIENASKNVPSLLREPPHATLY